MATPQLEWLLLLLLLLFLLLLQLHLFNPSRPIAMQSRHVEILIAPDARLAAATTMSLHLLLPLLLLLLLLLAKFTWCAQSGALCPSSAST